MKYFFPAAFLILSILTQGQSQDSIATKNPVQWIEPMNNYVTLKFTQSTDVKEIMVNAGPNKIDLCPNTSTVSRLGLSYKFISLSYAFTLKFLPGNDDDLIKGKTKSNGFGFGLNFSNWMQDLSYNKTKGYYLKNTSDFNPSWIEGDPYAQFPDFSFQEFQGLTAYKFNENYSVNAVVSQSERQLKSAGTFIIPLRYRYYIVNDKSPRVQPNDQRQKSNNVEIDLGVGYYYTLVFKKSFYIAGGATPAAGVLFLKLTTASETEKQVTQQINAVFRLDARLGAGYNGKRFFAGVYGDGFLSTFNQRGNVAVNHESKIAFQFFIGYRLNAPKFLKVNVEKAERLMKKF